MVRSTSHDLVCIVTKCLVTCWVHSITAITYTQSWCIKITHFSFNTHIFLFYYYCRPNVLSCRRSLSLYCELSYASLLLLLYVPLFPLMFLYCVETMRFIWPPHVQLKDTVSRSLVWTCFYVSASPFYSHLLVRLDKVPLSRVLCSPSLYRQRHDGRIHNMAE